MQFKDGSIREAEVHWYKATGNGYMIMNKHEFAICIDNHDYEVSLELRKLYEVIPDTDAEQHDQIRVIDESGEDYLYPATAFSRLSLPESVIEQIYMAHA